MASGGQDEEADVGCLVVPEGRAGGFLVEPALEQQILGTAALPESAGSAEVSVGCIASNSRRTIRMICLSDIGGSSQVDVGVVLGRRVKLAVIRRF